ncbi:hypothetical protein F5884DRAFT_220021 [Xylogone sp. PMI_703]|nr:hypothetical protein F5884DRAFT_220021 [Xylogone sp. PMI_703]
MAPSATDVQAETATQASIDAKKAALATPKQWVKSTGALNQYEHFDVTPVIGREFVNVNLVDWLKAPNSDELLRELALTISQRGVVFFRAQDDLTADLQKELIQKIGLLSGKPETSGLHIHPILNPEREGYRVTDPEISTIDSELNKRVYPQQFRKKKQSSGQWHSDIAFEKKPADYSSLRLVNLPKTGGDTLWASGYEIYDRISEPYQKFLEGLTATFEQPYFIDAAKKGGYQLYDKPRGAPENVGAELKAVHPVVRTNPVTGWKSIFPIGGHVGYINDVAEPESKALLDWFLRLLVENHDLQVRFKWKNTNDIAIWDNRSTFHSATFDYDTIGERYGVRTVSVGEAPFFDPQSKSRSEDLAAQAA